MPTSLSMFWAESGEICSRFLRAIEVLDTVAELLLNGAAITSRIQMGATGAPGLTVEELVVTRIAILGRHGY